VADSSFKEFVLEQLSALSDLRAKPMFGGHGLYSGKHFFAILFKGRLYFKTNASTQVEYRSRGMLPFTYELRGRQTTMAYYEVPPDILEDRNRATTWANQAIEVAAMKQTARQRGKG